MTYDFNDYIRSTLFINDTGRAADTRAVLDKLYQDLTACNPNGIGAEGQAIKVQQALLQVQHDLRAHVDQQGCRTLLYRINIQRDVDFRGGDPAYSVAPRLLFQVPDRLRNPNLSLPMTLSAQTSLPLTVAQPVTTANTVLIYPNQEGIEKNIEDHPVVQLCAVSPGDFVILGKVGMDGRKAVWQTVADVMKTPAGVNPFAFFDETGTVEDLADILQSLRRQGFGNQYNTNNAYREKLEAIPAGTGEGKPRNQLSGFYAKATDKTEATLRFVPGDTMLIGSGRAMETITGGGFALYEDSNGAERYAPLSRAYAKISMLFKRTSDPVTAEREAAPLKFAPDHPLRDFGVPMQYFLKAISENNRKYAPAKPRTNNQPGFLPGPEFN